MRTFIVSVEDGAECWQFVVLAKDEQEAQAMGRAAYVAEVSAASDILEVGVSEVDPAKGYHFMG